MPAANERSGQDGETGLDEHSSGKIRLRVNLIGFSQGQG